MTPTQLDARIVDDILKAHRAEFTALLDAAIQRALANLRARVGATGEGGA